MPVSQLLKGKIVTMTAEANVLVGGYIYITDGVIAGVYPDGQLPASLSGEKVYDTNGVIYPGLMDLHNHFVYNVLPLWVVPQLYTNRGQWPGNSEYQSGTSEPIKQVLSQYAESSKAIVRYVEAKALMSGTTTGQGIRTQVKGSIKLFEGAMRNVEEPDDPSLPAAGTLVPDLFVGGTSGASNIAAFRKALDRPNQVAYFYHLAEGVDDVARQHFLDLKDNDLIDQNLVGIHCLGLQAADLAYFAGKGAKVVWSPFSNQLLYGKTLDLNALKQSGAIFSIGCDWTPTGSKNLLEELKVAYQTNLTQGSVFSNYELIRAVTFSPAQILGWDKKLGTLETGKTADLLILNDQGGDVYQNLIISKEDDVNLVMVGGIARYGSTALMGSLVSDDTNPPEDIQVNGTGKQLYLFTNGSEINDLSFMAAFNDLTKIMSDLGAFVKSQQQSMQMLAEGFDVINPKGFKLVLDNEYKPNKDPLLAYNEDLTAFDSVKPPMQNSITIDSPFVVGDDYWNRVKTEKNVPTALIQWLMKCYNIV